MLLLLLLLLLLVPLALLASRVMANLLPVMCRSRLHVCGLVTLIAGRGTTPSAFTLNRVAVLRLRRDGEGATVWGLEYITRSRAL